MSFPNDRTYNFDANLQVSDNAAPYTATGFAQSGGANTILDLGGNQGVTPVLNARIDAVMVCDVTAIDIASADETYKLIVLGSNDAGMASGNVQLGAIMVGKGAQLDGGNMADSVTGRYEVHFTTNVAGSLYQYVALRIVIAGTSPSISIEAFVAVTPEP